MTRDSALARREWNDTLKQTARSAFEEIVRGIDASARTHKAVVLARDTLNRKLYSIFPIGEEVEHVEA